MANTNPSTNMNLPVPVVGVDPGPDYATDLNSCLTIIDGHNHSSGSGVQITPSGLNINSDFPINGNNLTVARSLRLQAQSVPLALSTDKGCLYEVVSDLYYNDASGNQIRITQSGAVAGSPGSISNLVSPASAAYVAANQTFVWQSGITIPANLDAGSVIFRNITAGSNGVTVSAPNALGSNYTLVLPSIPASSSFVTIDASGNFGTKALPTNPASIGLVAINSSGVFSTVAYQAPTIQKFLSGSGTYTTPSSPAPLYIKVKAMGGGGGGSGSAATGSNSGVGGTGGTTTFGSSMVSAGGGAGGAATSGGVANGGAGGTGSLGTGPIGFTVIGGQGGANSINALNNLSTGGCGGNGFFGGGGSCGQPGPAPGQAGATNTGGGGGGGSASGAATFATGAGGGSGAYVEAIISPVSATYAYSVGAAGSAGAAGTSGSGGGAGGSGILIIEEYYQ